MMRSSESTNDAKRKGKEIYEENDDDTMDFAEFYAQSRNKGITIRERSENTRSEDMTKFSGQKSQSQDMTSLNQVSPNYFLSNSIKEMSVWPRHHHKPTIIVHASKIVGPSSFSQNNDQNMQRTSVSAPRNFSLLKLLMEEENISTLTDEELIYAKELLSTNQGLSFEGQGVQQLPFWEVGNYQNMLSKLESATSNFSFMKLLMEDEESSILTNEFYEKEFLSTQYSLPSEGQMAQQWPSTEVGNYPLLLNTSEGQMQQQWPCSQVGSYPLLNTSEGQMVQPWSYSQVGSYPLLNASEGQMVQQWPYNQVGSYPLLNASEGQMVQQWPCSQVGNYPLLNALEGQMVQQWPYSQAGSYQFENSTEGLMVQQWPCNQVGYYEFVNFLQQINLQNFQNQVLQQPEQISDMDLLERDDISYMDLLTREDI